MAAPVWEKFLRSNRQFIWTLALHYPDRETAFQEEIDSHPYSSVSRIADPYTPQPQCYTRGT